MCFHHVCKTQFFVWGGGVPCFYHCLQKATVCDKLETRGLVFPGAWLQSADKCDKEFSNALSPLQSVAKVNVVTLLSTTSEVTIGMTNWDYIRIISFFFIVPIISDFNQQQSFFSCITIIDLKVNICRSHFGWVYISAVNLNRLIN